MSYTVDFSREALKTLKKYKKSDPQLLVKLQQLVKDVSEHPRSGIGHPEPLVGGRNVRYSRHISAHVRMIYDIFDDVVVVMVVAIDKHYNDK